MVKNQKYNKEIIGTPKLKELKHKARRYSIKEGIFSSIKSSFGDSYISPFAIAINSSNSMVALLTSIQGILSPLSQMLSSRLIEKYPRKKIVMNAVFFESLMWLPFIILAILFYKGILITQLPLLLLFLFSIYIILTGISTPAWFSWMGDIVDKKYRGRWFAKRNFLTGVVSIIFIILSAFLLDYFKKQDLIIFGFIILFFMAFLSRFISWRLLKKQYEPKIKIKKYSYFSFTEFILKSPKTNFGRFTIYRALIGFTQSISASLIAVYLLRELGFNYVTYMIILLTGSFFSLLLIELWGKFADNYGNYKILVLTSILISTIPFLWIINKSPLYLILIPQLVSGIAWSGFNLASANFIYDSVKKEKRSLAVSYYNMLEGIGIFLGAGLGALLILVIKTTLIHPIIIIFIISGILRFLVVFSFLNKIKEIRKTKKISNSGALKFLVFKEAIPTIIEEVHEIISIKKYFLKLFILRKVFKWMHIL